MDKHIQEHHGTGDIAGRDKYEAKAISITKIAGNQIVNYVNKDRISEDDLKEFSNNVHEDSIKHFKNLIDRIQFLAELNDFLEAKQAIDEATTIWHNYQKLMLYNSLCTFAVSETVELIFRNKAINKIRKLVEASKNIKEDTLFKSITSTISESFYNLIITNVKRLNNEAPKEYRNWRFLSKERIEYYRYAMAQHINRLEFCYEICPNIEYLKRCVDYLSGHQGFAWVILDDNGNLIDINNDFFEGGVEKKRNDLIEKIWLEEKNYIPPDLWCGDYNEAPSSIANYKRKKRWQKMLFFILVIIFILILALINAFNYLNLEDFVPFSLLFIAFFLLFHPFGTYRLSAIQKITRYIYKIISR